MLTCRALCGVRAGRAGRRGYDTQGHCVVVQSKWEDADAAWAIIKKGPEPLRSQACDKQAGSHTALHVAQQLAGVAMPRLRVH